MQDDKKNKVNIVLELVSFFGLCGSIGLEIHYMVDSGASVFYTVITCFLMLAIYMLLSVMQRYTKVWNLLIPATEENKHYAVAMALDLKTVIMCMTCYTAVCDVWNIYGNPVFFWLAIVLGIGIVLFYKYKMWKTNQKKHY